MGIESIGSRLSSNFYAENSIFYHEVTYAPSEAK